MKLITNQNDMYGLLSTPCAPVNIEAAPRETRNIKKIVDELLAYANKHYAEALGLSANQLGYRRRIFVMRSKSSAFFVVINPSIVAMGGGMKQMRERCLSLVDEKGNLLPGVYKRRPKWIKAQAWTLLPSLRFRHEVFELKGIDARVFLHEMDHLNGILI